MYEPMDICLLMPRKFTAIKSHLTLISFLDKLILKAWLMK